MNNAIWYRLFVVVCLLMSTREELMAQTVEAESGELSGTFIASEREGFLGTGYVTGLDATGDGVTVRFDATEGLYNLYIRYASPFGDKYNYVYVNGENIGSTAFPASPGFIETNPGKVYLEDGANTLSVVKDWGYVDIDNIRLTPAERSDIFNIGLQLVTPSPSREADSLYTLLSRLYGKVVLSGQYGGATEFDYLNKLTGKTPVVRGFDMIDYSPSRVNNGATSSEVEKAMEWSRQRGIVTFCWHWNAPKDLIDEPGREWWRGFYTDATTFDLTTAMNDEESEAYHLLIRDIDAIAVPLKKLADANIPVLWRPLHEAEGKWFWWGAKGAEPCKWLWKRLFERLVSHHGLDNLIWVWTSTGTPDALTWYPGDAYVDIVGTDIYVPAGTYGTNFTTFDNIASHYGGKKIIALSENGPVPDPEKMFVQNAAWSWFCTWSGHFITDGISNDEGHLKRVFNHDYVITLDEIDHLDAIIETLAEKKKRRP